MKTDYLLPENVSFIRSLNRVPINGFQWKDETKDTHCITLPEVMSVPLEPPFLVANKSGKFERIEPFKISTSKQPVFIQFALLQANINSIVEFANTFGYLLKPFNIVNYDIYKKEILECKATFTLWQEIQNAEDKKKSKAANDHAIENLAKMLILHDVIFDHKPTPCLSFALPCDIATVVNHPKLIGEYTGDWFHSLTSYNTPERYDHDIYPIRGTIHIGESIEAELFLKTIGSNDILLQAKYILASIINYKNSSLKTNPVLLLNSERVFQQSFIPSTLLAGIWLQFMQAFLGERKYKQCQLCKEWADVTGGRINWNVHSDCANNARVKKHREKQKAGE